MRILYYISIFIWTSVSFANPLNQSRIVYLASYPRSGNTLARYIIEYLTKRPTIEGDTLEQALASKKDFDRPLGWELNIDIDMLKPLIIKTHIPQVQNTPMIFLLRDYKEAITSRLFNRKHWMQDLNQSKIRMYFRLIEIFDAIADADKLLIYYEDLIQSPRESIQKILAFLGETEEHLDAFMQDFSKHKSIVANYYHRRQKKPQARDNIHYHLRNMSVQEVKLLEHFIKENYPKIYQKYLQRYQVFL